MYYIYFYDISYIFSQFPKCRKISNISASIMVRISFRWNIVNISALGDSQKKKKRKKRNRVELSTVRSNELLLSEKSNKISILSLIYRDGNQLNVPINCDKNVAPQRRFVSDMRQVDGIVIVII